MARPRPTRLRAAAMLTILSLATLAGACKTPGAGEADAAEAKPKDAAPEAAAPAAAPAEEGLSEQAFAAKVPGVDASGLTDRERATVAKVAEDALCDCGRPTTLTGCLREQPECVLGQRMGKLAVSLVQAGASGLEATDLVERYFDGFRPARREKIALTDAACRGPKDAPVTLVEFADYECPYCGFAWGLVHDVVDAFKGRVRWCFLQFPLSQHPHARDAARVAEYAKTKGKFFELSAVFFAHQEDLSREAIQGYAKQVGLDPDAVAKVLAEGTYDAEVAHDRKEGERVGVQGTPTLFIDGRRYDLPLNGPMLVQALEDELIWKSQGDRWSAK